MIGTFTGKSEYSNTYHIRVVKEKRCNGKKYWDDKNDAKLWGIVSD